MEQSCLLRDAYSYSGNLHSPETKILYMQNFYPKWFVFILKKKQNQTTWSSCMC